MGNRTWALAAAGGGAGPPRVAPLRRAAPLRRRAEDDVAVAEVVQHARDRAGAGVRIKKCPEAHIKM